MGLSFWVTECAVISFFAWYLYHYRAPSITQIEAYVLSRAVDGRYYHDVAYYKINGRGIVIPLNTTFLKPAVSCRLAIIHSIAKAEGVSMYTTRRAIWKHAKENGL